jgi:arginyl-tRNA synthetase
MAACRAETSSCTPGDPENVALWQSFMPACLEMLRPIYERLGVQIDHALGESFYNPMLPGVVEDMLTKGIAVESNGAVVIPNAKGVVPRTPEEQKKEEPPAIIRKRDGAFTYTTTDLATVKYRADTWGPDARQQGPRHPGAGHAIQHPHVRLLRDQHRHQPPADPRGRRGDGRRPPGRGRRPHGDRGVRGEQVGGQDYGDVVVHVFDSDTRDYYKLEELWADATKVDWKHEDDLSDA